MESIENIDDTLNDQEVFDKELKDSDNSSIQQILISLISDKRNLTLKTEIHNPKALASLNMLMRYFERINCPITASVIRKFIEVYLEYMVSYNRKSRKEIIKALSSWIEKEYSQNQNRLLISQE